MGSFINRIGQKFNMLTVISHEGTVRQSNGRQVHLWRCLCECGNEAVIRSSSIPNGIKSCGCWKIKATKISKTKHGHASTKTKVYRTWKSIKERCFNHNSSTFYKYGARGIAMYEVWVHSFPEFLKHVGEPPSPRHSIDRIDNNGNYEPGNVRWATPNEQAANTRRNVYFSDGRKTQVLAEWLRELKVTVDFIKPRLAQGIPFPEIVQQAKQHRFVQHWREDLLESEESPCRP